METGQKITEISFVDLKRGSKLIVETGSSRFEILVTGKRKDGLCVSVKTEKEEFTARIPGGFIMYHGVTPRVIRVEDCLYFENLKNAETDEKISSKMRTESIKSISLLH